MRNPSAPTPEIEALEREAMRATQSGREADAVRHWSRILELYPTHVRALSALGQRAFQQGDMPNARAAFQRIVDADGTVAQQWIHLSIACRNLYDDKAADDAIQSALAIDPTFFTAAARVCFSTARSHFGQNCVPSFAQRSRRK